MPEVSANAWAEAASLQCHIIYYGMQSYTFAHTRTHLLGLARYGHAVHIVVMTCAHSQRSHDAAEYEGIGVLCVFVCVCVCVCSACLSCFKNLR